MEDWFQVPPARCINVFSFASIKGSVFRGRSSGIKLGGYTYEWMLTTGGSGGMSTFGRT
jgi:hypothetical protein